MWVYLKGKKKRGREGERERMEGKKERKDKGKGREGKEVFDSYKPR